MARSFSRPAGRFESKGLRGHTTDQLIAKLAAHQPIPAIALIGIDPYLRELCRNKIIDTFTDPASRDWNLSRISVRHEDWDQVFDRAQTLPMLSTCQVVVVEDVQSIEKLGDESRDRIVKSLEQYLASPASFTVLVLEADSLDGRQKFTKVLHEKAFTVALEITPESAVPLAMQMARERGAELDRSAATLLVDAVNAEPGRMSIEIEKLATHAGSEGHISKDHIECLVVAARKNTVWQLADLIAEHKANAALTLLENLLREGEQPPMIVGALAFRYRMLIEGGGQSGGYSRPGQFGGMPMPPAQRASKAQLLRGLVALADADSELKSSNPDPRATLEFLIARLASPDGSAEHFTEKGGF
ncbi:MAG TPA: DNA polymerase III subunit delta [Candidatus Acidoferrum sp.]|nr:DNA polymerase III subunit delta [Candidatus Acidoferrum sp.]